MKIEKEELLKYAEESNGYITVAQIMRHFDCSRSSARYAVRKAKLKSATYGIFMMDGKEYDELYCLQLKYNLIYSYETSLYLHGVIDEPGKVHATMIHGNRLTIRKREIYDISLVNESDFNIGVEVIKDKYGNPLKVYSLERTYRDIQKHLTKVSEDILELTKEQEIAA